jgi:adenylate cyclase
MPLSQARLSGTIWLGAIVLFTTVNAFSSIQLAALIAVTTALGGLSSCALCYLLSERITRPVIAAALSADVPADPGSPGVAARVLVAWCLSAGVPLLGAGMLAIATLAGADVSATQIARAILFLCVIGIAVGLFAMRLTARSIADPIESVRAGLRDVEAGDMSASVPVFDGSEVGLLQAGFNRMAAGLEERERMRDLFGRHVGHNVAAEALRSEVKLGGEEREVAVLFVDVVGSTELAAQRSATEVVSILNDFFAVVVAATESHGGLVNKFEGDAALCVFGAPVQRPDAAGDALAAAREMRTRLDSEAPSVDIGIGVSAGLAVAGNIGAEQRFEYTVIGDPINEAARLCELAKQRPERVLASEAVLSRASDDERERWSLGEAVTLRGRAEPTRLGTPS